MAARRVAGVLAASRNRWWWWSAARRLDLARYWQARGDLDEAARHASHALRLLTGAGAAPVSLHASAALTAAAVDRDRAGYAAGHAQFEHAVRLLDAAPPTAERDRLLAHALTGLGDVQRRLGHYPRATAALRRAREMAEASSPPDPPLLAAVLTVQGITAKELGAYDQAARCYAEVAGIYHEYPPTLADQASLDHNLAGLAYAREQYPRAESHARLAVMLRRQAKAAEVDLAADLAVLAAAVAAQDRHDEARDHLRRALAACRAARPPRHYEIAVQLHNLAAVDQASGRLDDAERGYRQALALKTRLLGADHPEVGLVRNNLGTLLCQQHREGEAAACYRRALAIAERTYPPGHPTTTAIRHNLHRLGNQNHSTTG